MCFSPEASFTAAAGLSVGGALSVQKSEGLRQKAYAFIPIFFALQQFSEGLVWLEKGSFSTTEYAAVRLFVIFAFSLWPPYFLSSVYLLEPHAKRRRILGGFCLLSYPLAIFYLWFIIKHGIDYKIIGSSIAYIIYYPYNVWADTLYGALVCFGPLFSSFKYIRAFALALLISYWVAFFTNIHSYPSIWCFFGAVLSGLVYIHFKEANKAK